MTEENKNPESSLSEEVQIRLIRDSLIKGAFEKYGFLISHLKSLPVNQESPGIQRAYLDIDTAMLWFKEMLNFAQLTLAPAPKDSEDKEKVEKCEQ